MKKTIKQTREEQTIEAMIDIYCFANHPPHNRRCPECESLLAYAKQRICACPLQERKTTCAKCQIHCYKPEMRENIRTVMRYAGPCMLYRHPLLALFHLFDSLKSS